MTEAAISPRQQNQLVTRLGSFFLKITGWRIDDRLPDDHKMVVIFAPHTTNWDFVFMLMAAYALKLKPNWMGKKELFWGPLGWLFRKLGGIAIDRKKSQNAVEQTAEVIRQSDQILLGIAPEATRSKAQFWRSGFYHIARLAQVPVHFAYIDYPSKTAGVAPGITPNGDLDADMEIIQKFYADKRGKYPEKIGAIRFKPEV